jgi:ribosome maturation factor RimP
VNVHNSRERHVPGQRQRATGGGEELSPVIADAVARAGFELEELQVQQAGRKQLVKVVVDGENGIGLDEVAEVSRAVSKALDERDDVLASAYTLEVTSPGLDRPLTRPRHWRRARLRKVAVRLAGADGTGKGAEKGVEKFAARVGDAGDDGVELLVDGQLRRVAYAEIEHAVIEVEFREPPAAEIAKLTHEEGSR